MTTLSDEKKHHDLHLEKRPSSENDSTDRLDDDLIQDWEANEEKKLVRKIDLRVFPMLCIVFGLSLLDRTNISAAYIAGLRQDLQFNLGNRYSIALLVFFIGYGLFEIPSNAVIRRLGARYWLSFLIVAWGSMVLGMGFINDWREMVVLRAFLGVFEAGLFPGACFIIGAWYRKYETGTRISFFYMASLLASGFGPIFAYALSLIRVGNGRFARGWRWIFIIEGVATVAAGLISPWFLIEFPEKVKFLNDREKHVAIKRMEIDRTGSGEIIHPNVKQTLKLLCDWKIAVFGLLYFVQASTVYSVAFFKTIILDESFKFDYTKAQLLSSPPYVFAIICSLTAAWLSDRVRMRWPFLVFQSFVAIVGMLFIVYIPQPAGRYVGFFLVVYGGQGNIPGTLAYAQNQFARQEKKGVVAAAIISAGAVGGICGSAIFRSQDGPLYLPGFWATIGMQCVYSAIVFTMSMYFKRQNRLADQGKTLEGVEGFRYAP